MKKIVVVGLMVMWAMPSYAVLYSSNFEDYTVGLSISSQSPAWWNAEGKGVVAVDPLNASNKVVNMTNGATTFWLAGVGQDTVADPQVDIDMDLYISNTAIRTLTYALTDNDSSDVVYTAIGRSGADTIDYHYAGAWWTQSAPEIESSTWMHIKYRLYQVENVFSIYVNGALVLNKANCPRDPITTNTSTFDVNNDATVLVDNISVTVPEPATCVLLAIGGLFTMVRRNHK
jgi:hypothetical protein